MVVALIVVVASMRIIDCGMLETGDKVVRLWGIDVLEDWQTCM